jgi:hypothetical protein
MQDKILTADKWLKSGSIVKANNTISLVYFREGSKFSTMDRCEPGSILMYLDSDFQYEAPGMFSEDLGNDYGMIKIDFRFLIKDKIRSWQIYHDIENNFDVSLDAESKAVERKFRKFFTIL